MQHRDQSSTIGSLHLQPRSVSGYRLVSHIWAGLVGLGWAGWAGDTANSHGAELLLVLLLVLGPGRQKTRHNFLANFSPLLLRCCCWRWLQRFSIKQNYHCWLLAAGLGEDPERGANIISSPSHIKVPQPTHSSGDCSSPATAMIDMNTAAR